MARKGGLGKGLNALIVDAAVESGSNGAKEELPISKIEPNPNQPRKDFNQDELMDLAASIKKDGLLQPILVRPSRGSYQIIAGERRWQACKLAGLKNIPVRIVNMDDAQTMRVALIENLQRSDLNAIEEARGYKELMKVGNLTQAGVAEAVSKSRSTIANALRLLDLSDAIQKMIYEGKLTAGHARALLTIPEEIKRDELAQRIVRERLSVREAEKLANLYASGDVVRPIKVFTPQSYMRVEKDLKEYLNAPVKVKTVRGKHKIEIEFKDENDLQRIYHLLESQEY